MARSPRAGRQGLAVHERLHPVPPALQGAVVAVICRDTRGAPLDRAQRLSHFPASPLVSLSWFQGLEAGLVARSADGRPQWSPFGADVVLSGSQSRPTVSWAPTTGRGGVICFTPDVAQTLFGLDLARVHDRFVPAREALGTRWQPLLQALVQAPDDAATLAALEEHLAGPWRALQGRAPLASLRQLGRHWVERLAWQAHEWRRTHSPRQVERRIKAYSGRSLREWQSLVRTEGVFFAARERREAGEPFDWAALAHDEGFADQAHLSRASKRITGFPPSEFAQRFMDDESFWLYRLWV